MDSKAISPELTQELSVLYSNRFSDTGLEKRTRVWRTLTAHFFDRLIPDNATVLDIACGYGEFINYTKAGRRFAIDLNPDVAQHLREDVALFTCSPVDRMPILPGSVDVAFTSNFLEHLSSKEDVSAVFRQTLSILKPGGRLILMGPNIRYAAQDYWDFFDHRLPLSDRSVVEGLVAAGYEIERQVPRFLPFSMHGRKPTANWMIKLYLRMPLLWRLFGKQFLVVARKPSES